MKYLLIITFTLILSSCILPKNDVNKNDNANVNIIDQELESSNFWWWNWIANTEKWSR